MSNTIKTAFSKEAYEDLQERYDQALLKDEKEFKLQDGSIILTDYAKYLLEYLKPLVFKK